MPRPRMLAYQRYDQRIRDWRGRGSCECALRRRGCVNLLVVCAEDVNGIRWIKRRMRDMACKVAATITDCEVQFKD